MARRGSAHVNYKAMNERPTASKWEVVASQLQKKRKGRDIYAAEIILEEKKVRNCRLVSYFSLQLPIF